MTTDPHQAEISQEEKRRVLRNDARVREGSTLRDFADGVANEGRETGRFSRLDDKPIVKRLPDSSPWAHPDPGGTEPPLGYDINQTPDLGFPLNKSVAQAPAKSPAVETATERDEGPSASSRTFSFKRGNNQ